MSEMIEKFKGIKPGDFVCLTDEQTISDLMEAKTSDATEGMRLSVDRVRHIKHEKALCDWYLADLGGQPEVQLKLFLLVKVVEDEMDLRIYWVPEDFELGSRGDQVNNKTLWLFKEPESMWDFVPCELEFAREICQVAEDGRDVVYKVKDGVLYGECYEYPKPGSIKQPLFSMVVEYYADIEIEDPELLILEVGGLDAEGECIPEGGLVSFYQGSNIGDNDISLLVS